MEKDRFDTQEKKDNAIALFRDLIANRGWKLYVQVIDDHIEKLKENLLVGSSKQTMEEINLARSVLRVHDELKNLPKDLIKKYTGVDQEPVNHDPYYHQSELAPKEKKSKT